MLSLSELLSFCKRRGFIFQAGEIYGGSNGFWDYGPLGVALKRNIRDAWWSDMVSRHNPLVQPPGAPASYEMVGVETTIITHPQVWKTSGHYDLFHDLMVDCRETKLRYRYDQLRGRWAAASGRRVFVTVPPDSEDEEATVRQRAAKLFGLRSRQIDALTFEGEFLSLDRLGVDLLASVLAPHAAEAGTLTEPREFNLMFQTHVGPLVSESETAFLRPETAQGIFINFKNVLDSSRHKLPLGIAQIGKSFRNEITPRHFIFRSREFEQAEIEFFCAAAESEKWYEYWRDRRLNWYTGLGLSSENLRLRNHEKSELSHYSRGTADIEYAFPFLPAGEFGELEGIAHRGDFDLRSHMEGKLDPASNPLAVETNPDGTPRFRGSGKNLRYFDQQAGESYVPHVIEPSAGIDRALLAFLCDALRVEAVQAGADKMQERTVLHLHPRLAPVKAAVLPLVKDEQLTGIARSLYGGLLKRHAVQYDEKDAIGRRYRRNDEIGTPMCITIDNQTIDDRTVTFRDRDSMRQWRVKLDDCEAELDGVVNADRS